MLTAAAILLFLLGLLHSVLGEWMLFRRLPEARGIPALGFPPLMGSQSATFTLRACWHILTILGWTFALLVARVSSTPSLDERRFVHTLAIGLFVCALAMLAGTRGKHLGWIAFAACSILCWLG